MSTHYWVSRPEEDAKRTAAMLREKGLTPHVVPLLNITTDPNACAQWNGLNETPAAILITSANGVRALAGVTKARHLPIITVGHASAHAATALGFTEVTSAAGEQGGDVAALEAYIAQHLVPNMGPLVQVRGSASAGHVQKNLTARGFTVHTITLYKAEPVSTLPAPITALLARKKLAGALFFSPRTAQIATELVTQAGYAEACQAVAAYCLSPAVAEAVAPLPWRAVHVTAIPTQEALLAHLPLAK